MRKLADIHKNPNKRPFIKPMDNLTITPPTQPQYFLPIKSPMHTPARLKAMKSQKNLATNVTISYVSTTSPRPKELNQTFMNSPRPTESQNKTHHRTISQNCLTTKTKLSIIMSPTSRNNTDSKLFGCSTPSNAFPSINILKPIENQPTRPKLLRQMEAKSIISINDSVDSYLKREESFVQCRHTPEQQLPSPRYERRQSIIDAFYDGTD